MAPLDVVLDDNNAPQPDVIFVGKGNSAILNEEEQIIIGVPDLVVEVISPGSVIRDRVTKKRIYEQAGISEYWIIDPNNRSIEIYQLVKGEYEIFHAVEDTGKIKSSVLTELDVDFEILL